MTVEATALCEGDPYEGLLDLTTEVMGLLQENIARHHAWGKMQPISGGAPAVLEDIAALLRAIEIIGRPWEWFEWFKWMVLDPIVDWLKWNIYEPLKSHLTYLKDSILGWWWGAIDWILNHLTSLKDSILGWWWGAMEGLKGTFTWIYNAWVGWLSGAWSGLMSHLTSLKDSILGWWWGAIDWILGHLSALKDSILGWWGGAIEGVISVIENLRAFLHDPLQGLRDIWEWFQSTWAGQLLESLLAGFSTLWEMVITALREWWSQVHPQIMDAAEGAIDFARPYIEEWVGAFQEIPAAYLEWVAMTAGTDLALKPSTALTTAGSLYGMSIAAGSVAMTLATALNLLPATNWVGAQQFAAFISEAAGFEPLTRATYGVLVNEALAWPLRYHWNYQLRPKIPTEGALLLMGRKRGLSEGEWRLAMAYQGIPNWYLDKIYLFNWSDPSPFWVSRVTEAHIPDWSPDETWAAWADEWMPGWRVDPFKWVRAKLLLAGYERADVDSMIEAIHRKLLASPITQVKTSVRAMLREAYWTRADAQGSLEPMGVREEEIELLVLAEELDYQKRYLDDEVRYWRESFRKGEIDDQDLSLALTTIIVKPERVGQIVAREKVRALPKPKSIVAEKEDPLVTRLRRQAIDSWIDLYRDWQIDREELLFGLTLVTQDADLAASMVAVEETRYRPTPVEPPPPPEDPLVAKARRQAIASWVDAFRDGVITADQLELYLQDLIVDREVRSQVVALEQLRYRPTPEIIAPVSEDPWLAKVREETVRGHIEMFQKRLIALEELYSYLLADGLVKELARATVITQATKRVKVPPLDSPYFLMDMMQDLIDEGLLAYEEMYMRREIDLQQYTAWVVSTGVDPEIATYLADTLALRRFLEGL